MFNDKMDIDDMILDLSTRATKHYAKNDVQVVSVCVSSQSYIPDFWQVWFTLWDHDVAEDTVLDQSLQEASSLRKALISLDEYLDTLLNIEENLANEYQFDVTESIGFGD